MKKALLLLLVFCLFFCGCEKSGENDDDRASYVYSDEDDMEDNDAEDVKKIDASIDASMFKALGKTPEHVEAIYGKMNESIWVDGPIYSFKEADAWFAFSEYDFTDDNTYVPLGKCVTVITDVDNFVKNSDGEINDALIASLSDSGISKGYDEMDGVVYYEITHDEYRITIYEDSNGNISGDSGAYVRLLED